MKILLKIYFAVMFVMKIIYLILHGSLCLLFYVSYLSINVWKDRIIWSEYFLLFIYIDKFHYF